MVRRARLDFDRRSEDSHDVKLLSQILLLSALVTSFSALAFSGGLYSVYHCTDSRNGDIYTVETKLPGAGVGFLQSDITVDGRAGRRSLGTGLCASASSPRNCKGLTLDFYVVPAGEICDQDKDIHVGTMAQCDRAPNTKNDLSWLKLDRPHTPKLACLRTE